MDSKELFILSLLGGDKIKDLGFCEDCILGKSTKTSFKVLVDTSKSISNYVHSNLWEPSQVTSLGRARYFLTFINDFSRKVWVYLLKKKDHVFKKLKE